MIIAAKKFVSTCLQKAERVWCMKAGVSSVPVGIFYTCRMPKGAYCSSAQSAAGQKRHKKEIT
eukprot:6213410-Pleurochrysis_carterae.AAC.4